jgi:hypothetical protein
MLDFKEEVRHARLTSFAGTPGANDRRIDGSEKKSLCMRLETIDKEKAARAWKGLMSASEEISQKWGGTLSSGGN